MIIYHAQPLWEVNNMKIIDRIIGIWMVIAGGALFVFAHMMVPYMATFSGLAYFVVAIPAAILLSAPCGALIGFGMAQTAGAIAIIIEKKGGK